MLKRDSMEEIGVPIEKDLLSTSEVIKFLWLGSALIDVRGTDRSVVDVDYTTTKTPSTN